MAVFRIEVQFRQLDKHNRLDEDIAAQLREAGLSQVNCVTASRLFFVQGELTRDDAQKIADDLLTDPVAETSYVLAEGDDIPVSGAAACEVHLKPGVMDPVADSTLTELKAEGLAVSSVRTARRFVIDAPVDDEQLKEVAGKTLANDCIEQVFVGTAGIQPSPTPPVHEFKLKHVEICGLDDAGLEKLSRDGHLFLSLAEMKAVQAYFKAMDREPTDLELEMFAQTWSEHCVHKTLKSAMVYRGEPMPATPHREESPTEVRYTNLLKDTIARATDELIKEKRGPECLSVFVDDAGVIGFDDEYGIAFKVETHNHPSAIEPYGGAATGAGGCIRDVMGVGLGARPIANTDVFCVAPSEWPQDKMPKGVLHPLRVLKGIVSGVADYGNRMGIPTINGTVYFDPRFLGNPLVYCGCVGIIPRKIASKAQPQPGDLVLVIGGRTGRDGIHGATFSSAELTDTHADEFSHAVQIGNAITEKRCLEAMIRARDYEGGCLYNATTDCGAGGLSSSVGELGENVGVEVDLEKVPLKYPGLGFDEIWISEAQERMVLAVPPANLDAVMEIMREEEVEATVIGSFGSLDPKTQKPRLIARYQGTVVGQLDMHMLHEGVPKSERESEWHPTIDAKEIELSEVTPTEALDRLQDRMKGGNVIGKHWIIRRYDHEVQGGSVVKSLCGPGLGPSDAAVLRPRLDSARGLAVGCGMVPALSDVDPYWMAAASIDEAIRNVVAVGGNPTNAAVLDNFCWGRSDDRRQLGALVRACQACYDVAKAYGVPFISGKDSLNNEFALEDGDVESLIETVKTLVNPDGISDGLSPQALPEVTELIRQTRRLRIPPTLLISAISVIDDITKCVTPDLKGVGNSVFLVGGLPLVGFRLDQAYVVHKAVNTSIKAGEIKSCHDVSDGGWLVSLAEMAIGGNCGVDIDGDGVPNPYQPMAAGYVVEAVDANAFEAAMVSEGVAITKLATVVPNDQLSFGGSSVSVGALRDAWSSAE